MMSVSDPARDPDRPPAFDPDATLAAAAFELAGAESADAVFEAVLGAACDLVPWSGDPCVAVFEGPASALRLVASDGPCADWPVGATRSAAEWGGEVAAAMRRAAGGPHPAPTPAPSLEPSAGGAGRAGGCRVGLANPLLAGRRLHGVLLVTAAAPLPPAAAGRLEDLARDAALALDRIEHAEELERTGARLSVVVLGSPDLVLLMDDEGAVRYASPALEPILGPAPASVIGDAVVATLGTRFGRRPGDRPPLLH